MPSLCSMTTSLTRLPSIHLHIVRLLLCTRNTQCCRIIQCSTEHMEYQTQWTKQSSRLRLSVGAHEWSCRWLLLRRLRARRDREVECPLCKQVDYWGGLAVSVCRKILDTGNYWSNTRDTENYWTSHNYLPRLLRVAIGFRQGRKSSLRNYRDWELVRASRNYCGIISNCHIPILVYGRPGIFEKESVHTTLLLLTSFNE